MKESPEERFAREGSRTERFAHETNGLDNEPPFLDPSRPLPSARAFLARNYIVDEQRTLHFHAGRYYRWNGPAYEVVDRQEIRAQVFAFLETAYCISSKGKRVPFQPNTSRVSNVIDAIEALATLAASLHPPVWLAPYTHPTSEIVVCSNGLLHLPSGDLLPVTPAFFSVNALSFAFDRNAPQPAQWLEFLDSLWSSDSESVEALQDWFGYCLVADTSRQKIFVVVGPRRSGKGTIARILVHLLGQANVCGPTLASLQGNFGLAPLIGRQLAIISDARLSGRADEQAIAERLLTVSGEDNVTVDRKFLEPWTGWLSARFMILTNQLPRIADTSGALISRFIVTVLTTSFLGNEDHNLTRRLLEEMPGILNWAIAGWHRLRERGHFIQPASSIQALEDLEDLTNPTGAFLREICEIGPGRQVECSLLFCYWRAWANKQNRQHVGTVQAFGVNIRASIPGLRISQPRQEGGRARCYEGIALKSDLDLSLRVIAEALHGAEDKAAEEKTRRWK